YSSGEIGAVGPVTNAAAYYSALQVPYSSLDEMIPFAEQYNRSDPSKWEERLKLIGFCLLMKREVYDAVGFMDEQFTPGNYEDDDYCLRIRNAGYRLMICTDTFIHHEGSASFRGDPQAYYGLMQTNSQKFNEKWGFSPEYSLLIRHEILQLLDEPSAEPLRVLEIGCACGATLLELKNWYPNAELHGIELNSSAADIASQIAKVRTGNIETMDIEYPGLYFDYIICADVLAHLMEPWNIVQKVLPLLKEEGKLLASIPNVGHYSVIRDLLKGQWNYTDRGLLDVTNLRFFTRSSIERLFAGTGYGYLQFRRNIIQPSEEDETWMENMAGLLGSEMHEEWRTYQYLVKAYKKQPLITTARTEANERLKSVVRRIEWDIEMEESRTELIEMFRREEFNELDLAEVIGQDLVFPSKTASIVADILVQNGFFSSKEELLRKLLGGIC
ncbi:methyltransferase domain-containing protein, partial [Paenibacillus sepulcri]|nr:methyltransferase domain-containing protein [Paenibacillus sepulcri]